MIDTWEIILRATGGTLRLDKSYWCMIDYQHIGNRWVYRSIDQLPEESLLKYQTDQDNHYSDWNQIKQKKH